MSSNTYNTPPVDPSIAATKAKQDNAAASRATAVNRQRSEAEAGRQKMLREEAAKIAAKKKSPKGYTG